MMLYLDTNILIYSLVNQDTDKMLESQTLINQSITDAIHAQFAELYAAKIVTYDHGFRKFKGHVSVDIEILL